MRINRGIGAPAWAPLVLLVAAVLAFRAAWYLVAMWRR